MTFFAKRRVSILCMWPRPPAEVEDPDFFRVVILSDSLTKLMERLEDRPDVLRGWESYGFDVKAEMFTGI